MTRNQAPKAVFGVLASVGLACILGLSWCTGLDLVGQNETGLIMEISRIAGIGSGDSGDVLFSDVAPVIDNDDAQVTVNIFRKNPNVNSTSALEHVRLVRYEVRYTRSDGRNVEGVDVPFRITGPLNARLHTPTGIAEIDTTVTINVVRQQAKAEPPLRNLAGVFNQRTPSGGLPFSFSGAGILTTIAEITIHGETLTGEGLVASANMQVTFADFAD